MAENFIFIFGIVRFITYHTPLWGKFDFIDSSRHGINNFKGVQYRIEGKQPPLNCTIFNV
ncbi:MAG: hypothetical protein JJP05_06080 [cyanobacterium endosymbiont of Rhopalodia gibba]